MQVLSEAVGFLKRPDLAKAKPYVENATFDKILGWIKLLMLIIMSAFYMFVGYMHFARPDFYLPLMPKWMPGHLELVYLSGLV
jgi:hypothetical protein